MKKIIFIIFLFPSIAFAQNKMWGSGGFNINGYYYYLINTADSLFRVNADSVKIFKPVRFTSGIRATGLSSAVGNKAVRYNTATGDFSYSDTTIASGGSGITTLNTLTGATQTFAVGSAGTDFAISSSGTTHTFDIPSASATNRGLITTGSQTIAGAKNLVNTLTLGNGSGTAGRLELYRSGASAAGYMYMSGNILVIENASTYIELRPGAMSNVFSVTNSTGNTVLSSTGALSDNASALMTMNSTTKGLLIPKMTTTQRDAISSPATGLAVYDNTVNSNSLYDGTRWTYGAKLLNGSATLNFGNTTPQTSADLTITVTGAADGDVVSLGVPNASISANTCYTAWVSAANTVTVRFNNYDLVNSYDPASATFKVSVNK